MVQIRQSPDPDVASLPRDRYDIVTKDALHQFPEDILRTVLGPGVGKCGVVALRSVDETSTRHTTPSMGDCV